MSIVVIVRIGPDLRVIAMPRLRLPVRLASVAAETSLRLASFAEVKG